MYFRKIHKNVPEIWTAVNPEPQIKTQKNCKVTKHDTRIKIYKTQENLRWSVSKCQNFGSFFQTVTLKFTIMKYNLIRSFIL